MKLTPKNSQSNSEIYFLSIIEQVPHNIFWKNVDGLFLGCNKAFAKDAGFNTSSEVVGKTDKHMPWCAYADQYIADDKRVMQSGIPLLEQEERHLKPNGEIAIVLVSKAPLFDSNKQVIGILGIFTDITARKQMEECLREAREMAERANQAKIDFVQSMRHDIRTPIIGIMGCSEVLRADANTPLQEEYTRKLVEASKAAFEILNRMMDGVQQATGLAPTVQQRFDLLPQLQAVVDMHQLTALQKGLALSLDYDPVLPAKLIGDPDRIQRIALELTTNAFKYTEKGFVRLSVSLLKQDGRLMLKLQVADSGIGIPADKHEEIFGKFKQLAPTRFPHSMYKGMGLGLSNVKQLLEELAGKVEVESTLGVGSVFTCFIPVSLVIKREEQLQTLNDQAPTSNVETTLTHLYTHNIPIKPVVTIAEKDSRCRVLVVEDDALSAQIASRFLTSLSCAVDNAANAKAALACFNKQSYDLIFMDIGLPDKDGYRLTQEIQKTKKFKARPVPIVALTAHGDEESKRKCLAIGMSAALIKPLLKTTAQEMLRVFVPQWERVSTISNIVNGGYKHMFQAESLVGEVIDFKKALLLHEQDTTFLKNALHVIIDCFAGDLKQVNKACQARKWGTVGSIVQKLQGVTQYFGMVRLEQVCIRITKVLQEHPSLITQEGCALLSNEMGRVKDCYQKWLQGQVV